MISADKNRKNEIEENVLVASAAAGDSFAFTVLVNKYSSFVQYSVKSICFDKTDHEDMIQEGLIGLLKAVRTYDNNSSSFSTYASLCIKNSVISAMRKNNRNHSLAFLDDPFINYDPLPDSLLEKSAEEIAIDKEKMSVLYSKVMELLSEYERVVFELYLDGEKIHSIGKKVGKDAKSVSNAVSRIKKKLSTALKKYITS